MTIFIALATAVVFAGLGFWVGFRIATAQAEERLDAMNRVLEPERPTHRQHHNYDGPPARVRRATFKNPRRWL